MILHTWVDVLICEWAGFLPALVSVTLCWFRCPWCSRVILQWEDIRKRSYPSKKQSSLLSLALLRLNFWFWHEWKVVCLVLSPPHSWWSPYPQFSLTPLKPGPSAAIWCVVFKPLSSSLLPSLGPSSSLTCLVWLCTLLFHQVDLVGTSPCELYLFPMPLPGVKLTLLPFMHSNLPTWASKDPVKIGNKIFNWSLSCNNISIPPKCTWIEIYLNLFKTCQWLYSTWTRFNLHLIVSPWQESGWNSLKSSVHVYTVCFPYWL